MFNKPPPPNPPMSRPSDDGGKFTRREITDFLGDVLRKSMDKVHGQLNQARPNFATQPANSPLFKGREEILDAISKIKSAPESEQAGLQLTTARNDLSDLIGKLARDQSPKSQPEYKVSGGVVGQERAFAPGPKGTDDQAAWLTKDEFVVNADSAKSNRTLLEVINNARGPVVPGAEHHSEGGPAYRSEGGPAYLAGGGISPSTLGHLLGGKAAGFTGAGLGGAAGFAGAIMEIAEALKEGIKQKVIGTAEGVADIASPLHKKRIGEITGGMAAGPFEILGQVPGLEAVGTAGKFIKAIHESIDKLRDWNLSLHQSNLEFSKFSGSMAAVAARQQVRDILLEQERGGRRAAGAERLASSKHELEKVVTPWEDVIATLQAGLASKLNAALTSWFAPYVPTAEALHEYIKRALNIPDTPREPVSQWLQEAAEAAKKRNAQGRPPRLGPP